MSTRSPDDTAPRLAIEAFGSGPRLALVHGFTQTGRSFARLVPFLSQRFEVVTVDLPGHGRSVDLDALDLDEAGRMVADAVGDAAYVGYSMGARVVLHAGFVAPERVRSMVLAGVSPGIADDAERDARRRADDDLAERLDGSGAAPLSIGAFIDEWLAQPLFAQLDPQAAQRDARLENTPAALGRTLRHLGTGTQRYDRGRLARLSMPVLIVAGENDAKFRALAEETADAIGENATTSVIKGAGHASPFEQPGALAALLDDWMNASDGT